MQFANLIFLSWHTNHGIQQDLSLSLFYEHGKQKLRAAISPVKEATTLTHAWTKLHNEVMS